MNNRSELILEQKSFLENKLSWLFGLLVLTIGIINMFWGNDTGFGIYLALLSFVYFLRVTTMIKKWTGLPMPVALLKVILGVFIIWAAVGVGELFQKIEMIRGNS